MAFDLSKIGVKKNIPKVNFTSYSGLFVAPPKFGKTTTASKFPNAVIIPFEDGVKGQVANVAEDISNWDDFLEFIDRLEEFREEIGDDIQTLVFDTVNKAYDMCEPYTLSKLSIADKKHYFKPSDVPHGQFYPARDKHFTQSIDRILSLGFSILFLSHSKVKTIRPKDSEPYDVYSSTMGDRLEAIINPLVDFMLYGEQRNVEGLKKRALITKGNEMAVATGNRVHIEEDIIFDTEEEAMDKYQEQFKKTVMERLRKAGVTDSFESISQKQQEEKMEEVKKYIQEKKSVEKTPEELHAEIQEIASSLPKTKVTKGQKVIVDILGSVNFKTSNDIAKLEEVVVALKELKG
jgi:hypothetical protein